MAKIAFKYKWYRDKHTYTQSKIAWSATRKQSRDGTSEDTRGKSDKGQKWNKWHKWRLQAPTWSHFKIAPFTNVPGLYPYFYCVIKVQVPLKWCKGNDDNKCSVVMIKCGSEKPYICNFIWVPSLYIYRMGSWWLGFIAVLFHDKASTILDNGHHSKWNRLSFLVWSTSSWLTKKQVE